MEANDTSRVPGLDGVIDRATLYLCRQGEKWVVVIESDRFSGALRLRDASQDAYDARFELLSKARRACPDAAIASTDGALDGADYEWRVQVQGVQANAGDLGLALHRVALGQDGDSPSGAARNAR